MLQVRRDTRTLIVLLFFPAFLLMLLGYAVNFDVRNVPCAVLDLDKTEQSRNLITAFQQYRYFYVKTYITAIDDIDDELDSGRETVCIVIPTGFGNKIISGDISPIQVLIDGTNANTAQVASGYIEAIVNAYQIRLTERNLKLANSPVRIPVEIEQRIVFNQELKTVMFLLPGLIVFIMMILAVISTTLSVVREKELGTIEQIKVSPTTSLEWIIGKASNYFVLSLIASTLILIIGKYMFGVDIKGSLIDLYLSIFLFLIGVLGLGLLISTIAETQQIAFLMSILISMLPAIILSGFVFPIKSMPKAIQVVTYAVPARYFLEILRGIILKGTSISLYGEQLSALAVFAVIVYALSAVNMQRKGL
jgi:ABC-2 type transport system permease protein